MTRRKVEPGALDYKPPEKAAGNALRQAIALRQGVGADLARQLFARSRTRSSRCRCRSRATSCASPAKSATICRRPSRLIRGLKLEQPLQYLNFRE